MRDSALRDRLPIWPIRLQTQVTSPSSASTSVASTRRSTFPPEISFSSKSTTRQSLLPRTSTYLDIPEPQAAAGTRSKHSSHFVETWSRKLVANYDSVASRSSIQETCAGMDRETIVPSFFEFVSREKRDRDFNVVQTLNDRQISSRRKAGSARFYEAEADVEVKHW